MSHPVRALKACDLDNFLSSRPFSVVHLDAEWDGYREPFARRIGIIAQQLSNSTSFGYIDIDREPDHARSIHLLNVPACSYYRGRELVATVIGMEQDIEDNLRIVREGGPLTSDNKISRH